MRDLLAECKESVITLNDSSCDEGLNDGGFDDGTCDGNSEEEKDEDEDEENYDDDDDDDADADADADAGGGVVLLLVVMRVRVRMKGEDEGEGNDEDYLVFIMVMMDAIPKSGPGPKTLKECAAPLESKQHQLSMGKPWENPQENLESKQSCHGACFPVALTGLQQANGVHSAVNVSLCFHRLPLN